MKGYINLMSDNIYPPRPSRPVYGENPDHPQPPQSAPQNPYAAPVQPQSPQQPGYLNNGYGAAQGQPQPYPGQPQPQSYPGQAPQAPQPPHAPAGYNIPQNGYAQAPAGYNGYAQAPVSDKVSTKAIVGFSLVILGGLIGILSIALGALPNIAGIILSHIAYSEIKRTGQKGKGLALAGIIVGYSFVVLGIIFAFINAALIQSGAL
jgi:hypothetical protein